MAGILASILAGGAAGGAAKYGEVMDTRIEDKREAAKAEALEKRMKSLAQFQHGLSMKQQEASQAFQTKMKEGDRAYEEGKENVADADAGNIARIMRGETGVLGGDEYSVPLEKEDMKQSLTGKGLLALTAAERAQEKEELAVKVAAEEKAYKRGQDQKNYSLKVLELEEKLKRLDAKENKPLSVKDEKVIRDIAELKVYTDLGFEYDNLEKKYIKPGGTPMTADEKADADKQVNALSGQLVAAKKGGMSISEALAALGNDQDAQLKPVLDALQKGDTSVLDKMDDATLNKTLSDLAKYSGVSKNTIIEEIKKISGKGNPPPDPAPKPGILLDYSDNRKGDPLNENASDTVYDRLAPTRDINRRVMETLAPVGEHMTKTVKERQRPSKFN